MNAARIIILFSVLVCTAATGHAAGIRLSAAHDSARIGMTDPSFQGDAVAAVAGARSETVSFQVVVTAVDGNLSGGNAEPTPLKTDAGDEIPGANVVLYREVFVPIRHTVPKAECAPGLVPDALIPFLNPYTGEPVAEPRWEGRELKGGRFGAAGFEVWEGHNQPLWIDVIIPKEAAAGIYQGSIHVTASNCEPAEIPLQLEVWGFTLPDGPTHENHFGGVDRAATYLGLAPDSEQFALIEDRYCAMLSEHRINPPLPKRLLPKTGEDGTAIFDDETAARLAEFVAEHHLTNIEVPRAPFGDVLADDRAKAQNYYRSWYAFLEQNGWAGRSYLYMLDEPNDSDAYERVRQLGAMVHEGAPDLRCLVVEQPYTQKPDWGTLDDAIDIWCPLFGFIHEESVKRVQGEGDDVWSYTALTQTAPPYHPDYEAVKQHQPPFWQIDFPLLSYRIAPWLNRRYGITGLLYWSMVYWGSPDRNPWDDPGFRVRYNGEGALFYPGDAAGIEGPVASMRLKSLRDGMEDYEYFALLQDAGGGDVVEAIVREAVPAWGTWSKDPARIHELRRRLAEAILERSAGQPAPAQ